MTHTKRPLVGFLIALLAVALAGAGGVAYASHQFPDVGDAGFHDQIGAITDAGCATGFNDGTFRPKDGTTRGQFAFWMNNCGGRLAFDQGTTTHTDGSLLTPVATSITAGAAGSGGGYALIQLNTQAFSGSCTVSPGCQLRVTLQSKLSTAGSFSSNGDILLDLTIPADSPAGNSNPNGSIARIASLQAGDTLQVRAVADLMTGTGTVTLDADLTVTSFPFDGTGAGNPIP